ncbi:glycerate kinase [Bradyrhizobium sp. BR13661]|jgi:glycerate 2-kinase|uniref:glycerate kinase type-2 family protein n=1 Tax=Bradyrhizobium sp. BR13661 TaxID=2940622 RepID=UPI0024764639|nr:glycerate kinase [Bradyrhizobium sp. BR13661]MDH6261775.1 glycerate 2-kinase [Bradyrhizobium sp. BR13661]
MTVDYRSLLLKMFRAAVDAAAPARCVPAHLPSRPKGRTIVVGAGKAAAAMAAAVEANWDGPITGLVVTRYGHAVPCERIEVVEASHPVPDEVGADVAARILRRVGGLSADDLVLVLMSGGGSALLALPADGITLQDKQAINRALLACGAGIGEMNTVRKHLSAIKGGRLAVAAAPARVMSLAISDVPGDDISVIASGPTVPDASTRHDALAVLSKYRIAVPPSVSAHLGDPVSETPKPGDPRFGHVVNRLVATPQMSLEAAARVARDAGIPSLILGSAIEGEAREVGIVHAGIARQCSEWGQPMEIPCAVISGGETTVTLRGGGRGGRNAEFLLSLGIAVDGRYGLWSLAADTDGIDGSEDNAGAILAPDTVGRARCVGVDCKARMADNDAYTVFKALDDLVVTGPTRTNVNDLRVMLVTKRS